MSCLQWPVWPPADNVLLDVLTSLISRHGGRVSIHRHAKQQLFVPAIIVRIDELLYVMAAQAQ